jgi:hypothetical protein
LWHIYIWNAPKTRWCICVKNSWSVQTNYKSIFVWSCYLLCFLLSLKYFSEIFIQLILWASDMTQAVEYLPWKCKALNSNSSTAKKKKNPLCYFDNSNLLILFHFVSAISIIMCMVSFVFVHFVVVVIGYVLSFVFCFVFSFGLRDIQQKVTAMGGTFPSLHYPHTPSCFVYFLVSYVNCLLQF